MTTWEIVETDFADRDDSQMSDGASERLNNYTLLELLGQGMIRIHVFMCIWNLSTKFHAEMNRQLWNCSEVPSNM